MNFIVPDCQIRKVNGRIYGAGSVIPNYSEDPQPVEKLDRTEDVVVEESDENKEIRTKKKKRKHSKSIITPGSETDAAFIDAYIFEEPGDTGMDEFEKELTDE